MASTSSSSSTYAHTHERAVPHPKLAGTNPPVTAPAKSSAASSYLIVYNAVSAALWAAVLSRVLQTLATSGYTHVHADAAEFTKWTQTLAVLEVAHAAFGIVRTSLLTTIMQVASRFLLVWGIVEPFPHVGLSPAYSSMLIAWSLAEIIRYSYFALNLASGVPDFITQLRYNAFWILYPMGISSECWLVWKAIPAAKALDPRLEYALFGVLAIYVPGSYILFTHMMAQRRKVLRALRTRKTT